MADTAPGVFTVDGITYHRELPEPYTPPPGWRPAHRDAPFCERCWLRHAMCRGCAAEHREGE